MPPIEQLINYGALGLVVGWFMLRVEGILRQLTSVVALNYGALGA